MYYMIYPNAPFSSLLISAALSSYNFRFRWSSLQEFYDVHKVLKQAHYYYIAFLRELCTTRSSYHL